MGRERGGGGSGRSTHGGFHGGHWQNGWCQAPAAIASSSSCKTKFVLSDIWDGKHKEGFEHLLTSEQVELWILSQKS